MNHRTRVSAIFISATALAGGVLGATPTFAQTNSLALDAAASQPVTVTDELGTHSVGSAEAPENPKGSASTQAQCAPSGNFGGGVNVSLSNGFTDLAIRNGPCTAAQSTGNTHSQGSTWRITRETHGQFICRGRITYGYGTDVWSYDGGGWSWAGGTSLPEWDYHHGC